MSDQSLDMQILEILYVYYKQHSGDPKMSLTDLVKEVGQLQAIIIEELYKLKEKGWVDFTLTDTATIGLVSLTSSGRKIAKNIIQSFNKDKHTVNVNVVTVAMTHEESKNLLNPNTITTNKYLKQEDEEAFKNILKNLHNCGHTFNNLIHSYNQVRDMWTPLIDTKNRKNIKTIVESLVINELEDEYVNLDFLSDKYFDQKHHIEIIKTINASKSIIIVDILSLFYKELWEFFNRGSFQNPNADIAIFVISPGISPTTHTLNTCLTKIYENKLGSSFDYFKTDFTTMYEFGIDDFYKLNRHIYNVITKSIKWKPKMTKVARKDAKSNDIQSRHPEQFLPGDKK